jgi:single-strand DNA-binding protein
MPNFNQIIMMGHITRDIQLRYLPNNTAVADFGIATNKKWRDQSGNTREEVCFIDASAFGKTAENINKYFAKGAAIMVVGSLRFEQWEKDGQKRSKHKISVERFEFVGGGDGQSRGTGNAPQAQPSTAPQDDGPPPGDPEVPF